MIRKILFQIEILTRKKVNETHPHTVAARIYKFPHTFLFFFASLFPNKVCRCGGVEVNIIVLLVRLRLSVPHLVTSAFEDAILSSTCKISLFCHHMNTQVM